MLTQRSSLATDAEVVERLRAHIAAGTTDAADGTWIEPVANYRSEARLGAELDVIRSHAVPFCPSAGIPEPGSYLSRDAAGIPVVAARGTDGIARAFRNTCRHRGAAVASGSGTAASFVCPYHGWVYQLDGRLRRVSHDHGFPGLDPDANGLSPLSTVEAHGIVFVAQGDAAASAPAVDDLEGLITPELHYLGSAHNEQHVNWKLLAETFLEGYHIRFLHHDTFFPVQYDNINLVESFGPNSRLSFPYRNIERSFDVDSPAAVRGRLTFVYHLFPNVMVATFPGQVLMVVLDPVAPGRTSVTTFAWGASAGEGTPRGDPSLLGQGAAQDFDVAATIQHGLASGANDHLQFGRFEGAIAHFHRTLDAALEASSR
jgi:nitrite reductase/ring-hydroxylating ferredoxin subunit